jgi:hypothetical protein
MLENHTPVSARSCNVISVNGGASSGGTVQPSKHIEKRAFAAARRSDNADKPAFLYREGDILQGGKHSVPVFVLHRQIFNFDFIHRYPSLEKTGGG